MKKSLFSIIIGLVGLPGFATVEEDTVEYSVISNRPNAAYYGLGLSYDLAINSYNFTLAAFGGDAIFMHEKFRFAFASRYHLLERAADFSGNEPYVSSVYEPEHSRDVSFCGTYYFQNDLISDDIRLVLRSAANVTYVMDVPGKYAKRFGIDIGYDAGVTYYNFQDHYFLDALDMSGNVAEIGVEYNESSISTYYKYSYLKIGVSRALINQMTITTDIYGKKSNNSTTILYGHAHIALNSLLDDVFVPYDYTVPNDGPFTQYSLSPVGFNRVGGCVGWSVYTPGSLGWGAELGLFPGPKAQFTNNIYLNATIRFHFLGKHL